MNFIEIKDKDKLNNFLKKQQVSQFLQSWEWGEFQEKLGNKIVRLGALQDEKLIAVATLIKRKIFFGKNYFYCPRGPVMGSESRIKNYELFFEEIFKTAKKNKVVFFRFEPAEEILHSKFCILNSLDIQPSKTLILNLKKTEEDLLKAIHQKTRYNIRLAKKKGVEVAEAREGDFDKWWKVMIETSGRDGFRTHGKKYYQEMIRTDKVKLYLAKYKDKIIAGNIISFFGDTATYIHGASADEFRNVMAPYALQWHIIREAKNRGCRYYDFYGISEDKWPGVTRFKKGFGGEEVNYPGTFDLVFNKFYYNLYRVLRKIRRVF